MNKEQDSISSEILRGRLKPNIIAQPEKTSSDNNESSRFKRLYNKLTS